MRIRPSSRVRGPHRASRTAAVRPKVLMPRSLNAVSTSGAALTVTGELQRDERLSIAAGEGPRYE
jgi:hypothetical protein